MKVPKINLGRIYEKTYFRLFHKVAVRLTPVELVLCICACVLLGYALAHGPEVLQLLQSME